LVISIRTGKVLLVNLTRQQIDDSPSIDQHKPVSRQQEMEYHQHYGHNYYAKAMSSWGLAGYPVIVPPPLMTRPEQGAGDAHLRSGKELTGYSVEANDGTVGEISDFLVDGRTWVIREVVVECGHCYAGNKVVVRTEKISRINYPLRTVDLDSTREAFATASQHHDHQTHAA
jgi:hypothetical protein